MKISHATLMSRVRRLTALSLVMVVLNLPLTVAFASPSGSAGALGTLRASGAVTVNDLPALSGQTILSRSHIVTASRSNSLVELGNFTRLAMYEQTELALDFSAASISGSLRKGEIRAFIPADRILSITTPDGVVTTDSCEAAVFSIQVEADGTRISVDAGRVELLTRNNRRVLATGEVFSTARDSLAAPALNLSKGERMGIIAGIGAGVALLLVVITVGRTNDEELNFGGCDITLSPIDGPRPPCF